MLRTHVARAKFAGDCDGGDVFPFIINETRSGIPVNAGWEPLARDASLNLQDPEAVEALRELDEFSIEIPRYVPEVRYDFVTFRGAEEFLKAKKPRLIYVSMGETDDWAHAGRYDLYLDSAFRTDDSIRRLWLLVQSMPEYRVALKRFRYKCHSFG